MRLLEEIRYLALPNDSGRTKSRADMCESTISNEKSRKWADKEDGRGEECWVVAGARLA